LTAHGQSKLYPGCAGCVGAFGKDDGEVLGDEDGDVLGCELGGVVGDDVGESLGDDDGEVLGTVDGLEPSFCSQMHQLRSVAV